MYHRIHSIFPNTIIPLISTSVLDDNKLLTLPSGERLNIPDNVRLILEVDSLEQATPATVSRCGMVWFSAETVSSAMVLEHMMGELRTANIVGDEVTSTQISFLDSIQKLVVSEDSNSPSLVSEALEFALLQPHIMTITRDGLLKSLKSLLVKGIGLAFEYDEGHPDFPMSGQHMDNFAKRWLLHSLLWSFSGSASWDVRNQLGDMLLSSSGVMLPDSDGDASLADFRIRVDNGEFEPWSDSVPRMEIESHKVWCSGEIFSLRVHFQSATYHLCYLLSKVTSTDVVVTTTDTVRHSDILGAWLESRYPLILCGREFLSCLDFAYIYQQLVSYALFYHSKQLLDRVRL